MDKPLDTDGFDLRCLYELLSFGYLDIQWRDRNLSGVNKNILIYVSKINQSLIDLE